MKNILRFSIVRVFFALLPFALCITAEAATECKSSSDNIFPSRTAYIGVNMGGGWTEWKYLVDTTDVYGNAATPTHVSEGGPSWGVVLGYDVSKNFALEWQYMQFADAHITFNPYSVYAYKYHVPNMVSQTEAFSFSLKFLAQMGQTNLRAFAAVGPGLVHRQDPLARTNYCIEPYMSTGLVYSFTRHWMMESGFQYYTGFGKSEVNPVDDFIPFAWDAYGRLAYQF